MKDLSTGGLRHNHLPNIFPTISLTLNGEKISLLYIKIKYKPKYKIYFSSISDRKFATWPKGFIESIVVGHVVQYSNKHASRPGPFAG